MPKMKTKRAAAKRFSFTAKGKVKHAKAFRRHLLTKMNRKRKRNLRLGGILPDCEMVRLNRMLPHG